MDRREFFRRGISRVAEKAVTTVDNKISARAVRWIRPPYAKPELEFLLACTRCNACIEACPHNIIFPLSAKNGADVMNTPALDLLNVGCHLCQDWPCVNACETAALTLPDESEDEANKSDEKVNSSLPHFGYVVINSELCLPYNGPECGACAASCVVEGALVWIKERPSINVDRCIGCAMCREHCITEPKAISILKL